MTLWSQYANAPMATEIQNELYPVLRKELAGLSEYECVSRILNWVQTGFAYEYDEKVWGHDRTFFAEETLFYPYCDCEDRSVLFTRLVRDLTKLDCILIYYPGHLAAAVNFNLNVNGDYILAPQKFDWQEDYNQEGLSIVYHNGETGVVNSNFEQIVHSKSDDKEEVFVIPNDFDWGYDSINGFAIVEKNRKKGVINRERKLIVECKYDIINILDENYKTLFRCGIRDVNQTSGELSCTWSLISTDGKNVLKSSCKELIPLGFSLFAIKAKNDKFSIINHNGQKTTNNTFDVVFCFGTSSCYDNFSWEETDNKNRIEYSIVRNSGKYGIIDKEGKLIIPAKYNSLFIKKNNRFWANGEQINAFEQKVFEKENPLKKITEKYDEVKNLDNGLIIVSKDNYFGCINQIGTIIVPLEYSSLTRYGDLLVATIKNDTESIPQRGVINFSNESIVSFSEKYSDIEVNSKLILFKQDRHWGAFTLDGRIICEPKYDHIVYVADNLIKVGLDAKDCEAYEDFDYEDGELISFTNHYVYSTINWGLINNIGNVILPLEYRTIADEVIDGLLEIKTKEAIGYVDVTGHILIEPVYKTIGDFIDGYAIVSKVDYYYDEHGQVGTRFVYGVIDNTFKEIIPCVFNAIEYEHETGLFDTNVGYKMPDGRYIAEINGKELFVDKKYKYCKPFHNGRAIAISNRGGYGLIDTKSKDILPPIFTYLELVDKELYKFKINDLYGLVNSNGIIVAPNIYNSIGKFEDGLAYVRINMPSNNSDDNNERYGYIDIKGNEILPPYYEYIGKRNNNISVVMRNNIWGLFNLVSHQIQIIPDAAFLGPNLQKLCRINVGGRYDKSEKKTKGGVWGYISTSGQIVIEPIYENALNFSEGLAAIQQGGKWGFIGTDGKIVVPCEYDEFESSFDHGKGMLIKDDYYYIFDRNGHVIDSIDQYRYKNTDDYEGYTSIEDNPYYNDNLDMDQQSIDFWNSIG